MKEIDQDLEIYSLPTTPPSGWPPLSRTLSFSLTLSLSSFLSLTLSLSHPFSFSLNLHLAKYLSHPFSVSAFLLISFFRLFFLFRSRFSLLKKKTNFRTIQTIPHDIQYFIILTNITLSTSQCHTHDIVVVCKLMESFNTCEIFNLIRRNKIIKDSPHGVRNSR